MSSVRVLVFATVLASLCSCGGGGGGNGVQSAPVAAWYKFRRDTSNSGQGSGSVELTSPATRAAVQIDDDDPAPISASPAIGLDGTVYIGSEGGTLKALDPTDLRTKWMMLDCPACPAGQRELGALVSSPAVYTLHSRTSVAVGSARGAAFVFEVGPDDQPACTVCFQPGAADFGGGATVAAATFISSPTLSINPVTSTIAGIFIGARITVERGGGIATVGKLYALNSDGSLRWQFPRPGDRDIGAVTSSAAIGLGGTLYFTAADGQLYALASDGTFKWAFPIGETEDPTVPFAPSPLTGALVYASNRAGDIFALNPDGSFRWRVTPADTSGFASSLAAGAQALPTPTPEPTVEPEATGVSTPTPTPARPASTLYGITRQGTLVVIDALTGTLIPPAGRLPAPVAAPVVSSPAISGDFFLVFGSGDGRLHVIHSGTGELPGSWTEPLPLAPGVPIRSSPAIGNDGTIYVGADDGMLYAVGRQ